METKFQTSFIPKKPLVPDQRIHVGGGTSVFMLIAVVLFIASLAGAGLTFVGKSILEKQLAQHQIDLKDSENHFNISQIELLKKADTKITFAKQLLVKHLAVSKVFDIIAKLTIDGVRFKSLTFTAPDLKSDGNSVAKVHMEGVANGYSSIAFQSDVFGSSSKFGTNIVLKNPVLSDLSTNDDGTVGFGFSADIVPTDISYSNVLKAELQSEGLLQGDNTANASDAGNPANPAGDTSNQQQ